MENRIEFKTNSAYTDRSLTEFFFGKEFVSKTIKAAFKSGKNNYRVWQDGTGYLTIIIH